jgi:ribonuclease III
MADLAALEKSLGVKFKDRAFLAQALVHSSYLNEHPETPSSNERMEFLGDAVLGLVIARKLYGDHPGFNEGDLTSARALLVCRDALARVALSLNLGDYLYMGKGEETSGGRQKPANLASTLEAVIAALYLDQGLATAEEAILRLFRDDLEMDFSGDDHVDYKSRLQERVQAAGQHSPSYWLISTTGPDHDREFIVEVRSRSAVLGRGAGKNKKAAETAAARDALRQMDSGFTA